MRIFYFVDAIDLSISFSNSTFTQLNPIVAVLLQVREYKNVATGSHRDEEGAVLFYSSRAVQSNKQVANTCTIMSLHAS